MTSVTKPGGPTPTILETKGRKKRRAKERRKEEEYWTSLAGPVTIRRLTEPTEGEE